MRPSVSPLIWWVCFATNCDLWHVAGEGELLSEVQATLCIKPLAVKVLAGTLQPGFEDSTGESSSLNFPQHICQPDANTLYIADRCNGRIRCLDLQTCT
jgi:hypothetical protein